MRMLLVSRSIVVALLAVFASLVPPILGEAARFDLFSKFTIVNVGHVPITGIYDKSSGTNVDWGKNQLSAPIDPGKEFVLSFPMFGDCSSWDIRVSYNFTTTSEYRNVDLCTYSKLGFAGPPMTNYSGPFPTEVTVANFGPADMLGFYILPSTSTEKSYGQNRLPAGPLRKDQKAVIPLLQIGAERTCLYDMRADFQGGNKEQRYRVNICEISPG
ncbi:MAG: hypothetical protein WBW81_04615, partial [Methylocella sp.]